MRIILNIEQIILIVQDWSCLNQTCCLKSQFVSKWFKKLVCHICSPCPCEYPRAPVTHGWQGVGAQSPFFLQAQTTELVNPFSWKLDDTEKWSSFSLALPNLKAAAKTLLRLIVHWCRVWRVLLHCLLEGTKLFSSVPLKSASLVFTFKISCSPKANISNELLRLTGELIWSIE